MKSPFFKLAVVLVTTFLFYSCTTTGTREEYFGYSRPKELINQNTETQTFSASKNTYSQTQSSENNVKYYIYNNYNVPWWDIYSDGFYYRSPGIYVSYYYHPDYYWYSSWRRHYYRHYYLYPDYLIYYQYPYYHYPYYLYPPYKVVDKKEKEKTIRDFGPNRGRYTYENPSSGGSSTGGGRSSRTQTQSGAEQKRIDIETNRDIQNTKDQNTEQQDFRSIRLPSNNIAPPNIEKSIPEPSGNTNTEQQDVRATRLPSNNTTPSNIERSSPQPSRETEVRTPPPPPPPSSKPESESPKGGSGSSNQNEDQRSRRR